VNAAGDKTFISVFVLSCLGWLLQLKLRRAFAVLVEGGMKQPCSSGMWVAVLQHSGVRSLH
jgi:hypothetical protein